MSTPDPQRSLAIRAALQEHATKRLHETLAKITGTDAAAEKEQKKQKEFFDLQALLDSGAECVGQIQMATHIVKGIHPDLKVKASTSLSISPSTLPDLPLVGSHVLRDGGDIDATGNGAFNKKVYEVFLLLQTKLGDESILDMLKNGDIDAIAALSDNPTAAAKMARELAEIDSARCMRLASHSLAKQIYWPIGSDPHEDAHYHILAPLYPTSLVHRFYQTLQDDRFSEDAKAARAARKAQQWHERPVHEYPNLAVQKLGGTKPQNISQLNSERRGDNLLLASLPPVWQSLTIKPLLAVESLFNVFGWRREVKTLTRQLRHFLERDPSNNLRTRQRRDALINALIDELIQFSAELRTLEPGWSKHPECDLPPVQRAWLDPDAEQQQNDEVIDGLADDFSRWLNNRLRQPLPLGDPEYLYWRKLAGEQLQQYAWEASHDD